MRLALLVGLLAAAALAGALTRGEADPPRRAPAAAAARPVALTTWTFREDRRGDASWAGGLPGGRPVSVPFVANPGPASGAAGRRAQRGSVGWFQRVVSVPRSGRYAIRFESAHHRAVVHVDGRRVAAHVGAYEPFAARAHLRRGRHRIVVRVDWRDPARQRAQGWHRGWFNWGGLNGEVTMTRMAPTALFAPSVRTRARAGAGAHVTVRVRVRNRTRTPRRVAARGRVGPSPLRFAPARLAPGERRTLTATTTAPRRALWSPRHPRLHDLHVEVPGEAVLDRRVGLRELRWDGGRLRLNGEPLVLRGASLPPGVRDHGDAFSEEDLDAILAELRSLGANATRAQRPLPRRVLERLDAAGILVWMEVGPWQPAGVWAHRTPAARRAATARVLRAVRDLRAHPSVAVWSLTNEVAAQGHPAGQAEWVRAMARRLRRLDPSRPVAADLWGRRLPQSAGALHEELDAIGVTDYVGWYEERDLPADMQERVAGERLRAMRRLFPGKVLAVTEVGAESSARNQPDAPGGLAFHADLLSRRLGTYRSVEGLDGALVWNLRDFPLRPDFRGGSVEDAYPGRRPTPGINAKGLFTLGGRPKPAVAPVRSGLARLGP